MAMTLGGDGSASGLVLTQAQVSNLAIVFHAYANTATTIPHATATKILLAVEDFDSHAYFDPAMSRFTPKVAGYYFFHGEVAVNVAGTTNNTMTPGLAKNGTIIRWGNTQAYPGNRSSVASVIYLNGTTDYVELHGYHTYGVNTTTVATAQDATYFSGFLVRAA